jgi:hypothetical protein
VVLVVDFRLSRQTQLIVIGVVVALLLLSFLLPSSEKEPASDRTAPGGSSP